MQSPIGFPEGGSEWGLESTLCLQGRTAPEIRDISLYAGLIRLTDGFMREMSAFATEGPQRVKDIFEDTYLATPLRA